MVLTELLDKGGIVMAIIMLLSVYVVAVILYKTFQFIIFQTGKTDFINLVIDSVDNKKYSEAARIAGNQRSPVARVIETALRCITNKNMDDKKCMIAIEASGARELKPFEKHLRGLDMAANIAPLLGLLGTVIGMVKAFAGLHQIGTRVDPSALAGGIWEALLTTVAGLIVAVPALAAHYIIDGKIEELRANMKDAVAAILTRSEA